MWLTVTLWCVAYFFAVIVTYGICEYEDLTVDNKTGEIKKKYKNGDEVPNAMIAIFWPITLIAFIAVGPFVLAEIAAKKIKKMQNPKKMDFNNGKYE
jgi:hypothetical protein